MASFSLAPEIDLIRKGVGGGGQGNSYLCLQSDFRSCLSNIRHPIGVHLGQLSQQLSMSYFTRWWREGGIPGSLGDGWDFLDVHDQITVI